jgi:hypothetical protein
VLGYSKQWKWTLAVLTMAFHTQIAFASNKLELKRENNVLTVALSNTDSIAGFEFTVNARGGIALRSYRGSDRAAAAGLAVYQMLRDDATLNVIMIAPFHSSLPAGDGSLGQIAFELNEVPGADTVTVFLSRVVICNTNAEYLEVTSTQLTWNIRESSTSDTPLFILENNFPNPFNPSTTITYTLERPAAVRLVIFDVSGRELNTLVNRHQSAGRYTVRWNAAEIGGLKLASGVYVARLQAGDRVALQKMVLAK